MPTPLRHLYATPAECARSTAGPIIAHDFKQADAVDCYKNGLSMVGTVPVRRRIGAIYPGTNSNYWQLNNVGGRLNKPVLNVVCEFWPEFAADDGASHYLFDTNISIQIVKYSSNVLLFYRGANVMIVALATYQAYWYQNQRNVIVLSALSTGNNTMWLNGVAVGSNATAWTVVDPTTLYLGSTLVGASTFSGKYGSIKIFTGNVAADLFTLADAQAYWKNEI